MEQEHKQSGTFFRKISMDFGIVIRKYYRALLVVGGVGATIFLVHQLTASIYTPRIESLEEQLRAKDNRIKQLERELIATRPDTATVKGLVTDIFENPTHDATVAIARRYFAITDDDGKYAMEAVPVRADYRFEIIRCPDERQYHDEVDVNNDNIIMNIDNFPQVRITGTFTQDVEARNPVGEKFGSDTDIPSSFFRENENIFLHTSFFGVQKESQIRHVWYYNGKKVGGGKTLKVAPSEGSHGWRTWSEWAVQPEQKGEWKVEVTTISGKIIRTFSLLVVSP